MMNVSDGFKIISDAPQRNPKRHLLALVLCGAFFFQPSLKILFFVFGGDSRECAIKCETMFPVEDVHTDGIICVPGVV